MSIRNCIFKKSKGVGLRVEGGEVEVRETQVSKCRDGMVIGGGAKVLLERCRIEENIKNGIGIEV